MSDKKLVILDTDPGIDDAMALLLLRATPGIVLHSITTVFGNGEIATTTRNAAYLVERFGLDLKVFGGAAEPLTGTRLVPRLKVHGEDGLGDTGLAKSCTAGPEASPAWQHIAETVRGRPGQVSLLAIGPLTNLALVLRHAPDVAPLVREVVVMGGAFGTKGRHGNIRHNAEANFFYDAQAADEVLGAPWPVTVVGLDVSNDCILTSTQADVLASEAGEAGRFLRQISRRYEEIYRSFDGIDGFCIHDVAAAAWLIHPGWFQLRRDAIRVVTDGEERGRALAAPGSGRPAQSVCVEVDAKALVDAFVAAITAYGCAG